MGALLPYLDPFWRESVEARGIELLDSISYPPGAPLSARADFRDPTGRADTTLGALQTQVFERWGADYAICNCIYGVHLVLSGRHGLAPSPASSTTGSRPSGSPMMSACALPS